MNKQDRQGARSISDLERKYNFGKYKDVVKELRQLIAQAQQATQELTSATNSANENINVLKKDYIVEQGVAEGWNYRKWKSGLTECWCEKTILTDCKGVLGALFYTETKLLPFSYPFEFANVPLEFVSVASNYQGWLANEVGNTALGIGKYYFISPTEFTDLNNITYKIYVRGEISNIE